MDDNSQPITIGDENFENIKVKSSNIEKGDKSFEIRSSIISDHRSITQSKMILNIINIFHVDFVPFRMFN